MFDLKAASAKLESQRRPTMIRFAAALEEELAPDGRLHGNPRARAIADDLAPTLDRIRRGSFTDADVTALLAACRELEGAAGITQARKKARLN